MISHSYSRSNIHVHKTLVLPVEEMMMFDHCCESLDLLSKDSYWNKLIIVLISSCQYLFDRLIAYL